MAQEKAVAIEDARRVHAEMEALQAQMQAFDIGPQKPESAAPAVGSAVERGAGSAVAVSAAASAPLWKQG